MSTRTLTLIIVLILVTAGLVWIATATVPYPTTSTNRQAIVPKVTPPVAQTVLRFDDLSMATNSAYTLPIIIQTGKNLVTAVQLDLLYDPKVLSNVKMEQGTFFTNPVTLLNSTDAATGRVSYALGVGPQDHGKKGEDIVAIIRFNTKSVYPQATSISFLPKTLVTAEGIAQSVLKSSIPSQFVIGRNVRYTK